MLGRSYMENKNDAKMFYLFSYVTTAYPLHDVFIRPKMFCNTLQHFISHLTMTSESQCNLLNQTFIMVKWLQND